MADRTVRVRLEAAIGGYQQGMRRAAQETRQFGGQVGQTIRANEQSMTRVGIAAVAMGGAILLGMRKGRDAANELNAEMANVATLIPGATGRVVELRGEVQTLAVDVGKGTSDIAGGLYQVVSAFGDTADTADILRINAEGARAGLASTTDAINLTSAVTKGYGDTTADAVQHASDLAFTTVRLGQTTFPELAGSIGRVVPLAAAMNVTQEELFGTMATFTGVTGGAAEVSTQFASALAALQNPSDRLRVMMDELGFASGEAMIEALGFEGALKAIVEEAEASGVPLMEFLRRKEAIILALAGAGGQADVWTEKNAEMASASGAQAEALAEQTEGINAAGFTAEQAAVKMEVAWQNLGEAVAPTAGRMAEAVGNAAERFSELDPATHRVVAGMAGFSGVTLAAGGAALLLAPRILMTADAMRRLGITMASSRAMMMRWLPAVAAAIVVNETLGRAWRDGARDAREQAAAIHEQSRSADEAAGKIRELRDAHADEAGRSWSEALKDSVTGLVDPLRDVSIWLGRLAGFDLGEAKLESRVKDVATQFTFWREETKATEQAVFDLSGQIVTGTGPALARMDSGVSALADAVRDTNPELAAMLDELEGVEVGAEDAESVLDGLGDAVRTAAKSLGAGVDAMGVYQDNLSDLNTATREAAEEQAQQARDEIQRQIDRTDATTEEGKKRIEELRKEQQAVDAHYDELEASFDVYMKSLDQALKDQREWHKNLNTIREAAGDEYADMLAAQGPEYAGLHAEIAKQETGEIQKGADAALKIRDEAAAEGLARLIRAGVQIVDETGNFSQAAVDELAKEMGVTPAVIEGILRTSRTTAEAELGVIRDKFGEFGGLSGQELAAKMAAARPEVLDVVRRYGRDIVADLNPILSGIGSPRIVYRPASGAMNTGGQVPGSGPDRDSVMIWATPKEYVTRRRVVEEQGVDKFEMLNRGQADIIPRFNLGGYIPDGLPAFQSGGRVTGDIRGLNAAFLRRMQQWAAAMSDTIHVVSGFRSFAQQAALFARYGSPRAAPPGRSMHERGLAADMQRWGHRGPRQHGLHYPLSWEPWHLEPIGIRGGPTATGADLMSSHVTLSPVPDFPHEGIFKTADERAKHLREKAQEWVDQNAWAPAMDTGPSVASGPVRQMAQEMLRQRGWGAQWPAFNNLVQRESSWNPRAQNPTSTAFGLMQFLNSTWAGTGISKTTDPARQLEAGMRYIAQRYGNPNRAWAFWQRNRWYNEGGQVPSGVYDQGGVLPPGTSIAHNYTGQGEIVGLNETNQLLGELVRHAKAGQVISIDGREVVHVVRDGLSRVGDHNATVGLR